MKTKIMGSIIIAATLVLNGCVTKVIQETEEEIQALRKGPRELPERNITDFAEGLRCMDNMFVAFGFAPNSYVMLLEDIKDKTDKVKAGTREMLISAISDMTRRSQAIQVIAFGNDSGNLVAFLNSAEQKGAYQNIPPYDIIGAVSQLDKDLLRKQADAGLQTGGTSDGKKFGGGFGLSASNAGSILGLDLSVITTHNMAVIPGVTTRNAVVIYKTGKGGGFDAGIQKTGINYSISTGRSDGQAQALRALIELSAIELAGKMAKLPYWKCLGLDADHPTIERELSDWHYQLTQSGTIHSETKVHLYLRGYYAGPLDTSITPEYQAAVIKYKERLGLEPNGGVDLAFYRAFLNDSPNSIDSSKLAYVVQKKKQVAKANAKPEPIFSKRSEEQQLALAGKPATPEKLSITLASSSVKESYVAGEDIFLTVKSNTNGYVDCYMESGDVYARIFPNRFSADGFISNKGLITLPDSPAYSITSDKDGEKIHCVLTTEKIQADLPAKLRLADFDSLPIASAEEIFKEYEKATTGRYAKTTYTIKVQ